MYAYRLDELINFQIYVFDPLKAENAFWRSFVCAIDQQNKTIK